MGQNQLVVVTPQHHSVAGVVTKRVAAQLDTYLGGTQLTGAKILTDLMVQLTQNPKLQRCTQQSLYACVVFAAKAKRSFGPYGVWMVPRDTKTGTIAIAQLSYQSKNTSARERGAFIIQSEVVLKGEKIDVVRDGGIITAIVHPFDYFNREKPTVQNVVGAYGIVEQADGKRFFKVLAKHDIDRAFNASASGNKGPWGSDYEAMVRKTVEARMQEDYVGDFTQYGGGIAAGPPPELTQIPESVPSEDLATEFFEREEHYEPTPLERAQTMVETCQTVEQVDAIRHHADWPVIWEGLSGPERKSYAEMAEAKKAELQQPQQDEQDEQDDAGADAPKAAAPPGAEDAAPASSTEQASPEGEGGQAAMPLEEVAPLGQPPAFPTLPENVQPYEDDKKGNPIKAAIREIRDAWGKLGQQPSAVLDLIGKRGDPWAKMLKSSEERTALEDLTGACLVTLEDSGYPHELPK